MLIDLTECFTFICKFLQLLAQMDTNRKILVSGTPVQNDLKEFYTLADFVNPGILGNPSSEHLCF